ncbi:glycosyltransferase [Thiocapsa marina]|uniref:Glycosyl transferase group 1 n=1 Tax=Thiocapsa marina 5811 TaxID=768671 RepID=F9U971_9GAMM|nr:glycosyltransferase [Thiocapsa marina]EGV19329.1 glycosyl transferase group 1 [Thiocapsa marina 5811]
MRVLHVGKFYPPFAGGMEYFLFDLIGALREGGVDVAALVHHERFGPTGARPDESDPSPVYRAPTFGRLLYVPVSPTFPFWLDRAIREFRPDLLHLHLPNSSALFAMAIARARRLPWVVHWHADLVASKIDRRLALAYRAYRPLEQRLLNRSDAIVATSPTYLAASEPLRSWRSRCTTIPLGLDPRRLSDPDPDDLVEVTPLWGSAPLRVLAIGRLTYYKGHEVLIRAISRLPEVGCLIVGAGEKSTSLLALIRSLGLSAQVRLLGFRSEQELRALLATCDVVCLPSLERTEAFGLVLLEAMRFSKPVVVSDIPGSGTGWLVRRAGHGLLTPPGDAQALACALSQLKSDPQQRRALGARGVAALAGEFGIDAVGRQVRSLYQDVLARTNQGLS